MTEQKSGLGKGLSALFESKSVDMKAVNEIRIADAKNDGVSGGIFEIEIDSISYNPFQPREDFNEDALNELADSIKHKGLIQPVTVKTQSDGRGYVLIAGERRIRAAKIAGLTAVPAFVYNTADESKQTMIELALLENLQRKDLNPMELSDSYQRLIDECSLTQEQVAARMSKQRSTIANFLRLQRLPAEIKVSLRKSEITEAHARTLLRLESTQAMLELWRRVISENISVRRLEEITQGNAKKKKKKTVKIEENNNSYFEGIENKLRMYFGTRVVVKAKTKQTGEIIIEYYSNDDLDRILEIVEK
ncbi:MAG: ParB/RepB/Spo0J family partition protein [Ignavibacteriae bacterium]|jgi:ParB family chromosome partitioning protein|nr:ParB/RepB/Spo0J family partition protein [Ignavibacteriota bacterium]